MLEIFKRTYLAIVAQKAISTNPGTCVRIAGIVIVRFITIDFTIRSEIITSTVKLNETQILKGAKKILNKIKLENYL